MEELRNAVLELVAKKSQLACEVREELVKRGFNRREARAAIFELWVDGVIDVGSNQLLHVSV